MHDEKLDQAVQKTQTAGDTDTNRNSNGHERDCFLLGSPCGRSRRAKAVPLLPAAVPVGVRAQGFLICRSTA